MSLWKEAFDRFLMATRSIAKILDSKILVRMVFGMSGGHALIL
jgi:hypothetical protein